MLRGPIGCGLIPGYRCSSRRLPCSISLLPSITMSLPTAAGSRQSSTPSLPWRSPPPVYRFICIFKSGNRRNMSNKVYFLAAALFLALAAAAQTPGDTIYLLRPDRVFDGEAMHEGWVVLVRGKRIESAGPASSIQALAG